MVTPLRNLDSENIKIKPVRLESTVYGSTFISNIMNMFNIFSLWAQNRTLKNAIHEKDHGEGAREMERMRDVLKIEDKHP